MNARFYLPDAQAATVLGLPGDEARHLARVLRLRVGDPLVVFDGRGAQFEAVVERIVGERVDVRVGVPRPAAAEPRVKVTLVQALLKGDKMDDVVRDAVMLGVSAVQPLVTGRAEIARAALERSRRVERWSRIAVSSAKQCGRAVVPPVLEPIAFEALSAALSSQRLPAPALMLVEPGASADSRRLTEVETAGLRELTIVIGPEGGWTPEEIAGAASCRPITLGERTIRADAMATVAIAALFTRVGEF